jgi:hypothetical protein
MGRILVLFLLVLIPTATPAIEGSQVMYVGGTAERLPEGLLGRLDTTSQVALNFDYAGGKLVIPFVAIDSFEYSQQIARHLGVLPAIAVGLAKRRQRGHFLRVTFHGESGAAQVAVFEVSKETPRTLLAILEVRAPQGCRPPANGRCSCSTKLRTQRRSDVAFRGKLLRTKGCFPVASSTDPVI